MFVVAEMLGHLFLQRRLDHRLGQCLQQAVRAGQRHPLVRAWATRRWITANSSGDGSRWADSVDGIGSGSPASAGSRREGVTPISVSVIMTLPAQLGGRATYTIPAIDPTG